MAFPSPDDPAHGPRTEDGGRTEMGELKDDLHSAYMHGCGYGRERGPVGRYGMGEGIGEGMT